MLFSPLAWAIFAFTMLITLPGALASPAPKRSKRNPSTRVTVESYPAIVGDEEEMEISVPRSLKPSSVVSENLPSPKTVAKRPAKTTNVAMKERQPIEPSEKFEVVPANKREQVAKRMHLCETLFMETGRAYDYRRMTTRELEGELQAVRVAKAQPVARPAEETIPETGDEKDPILNPNLSPEVE